MTNSRSFSSALTCTCLLRLNVNLFATSVNQVCLHFKHYYANKTHFNNLYTRCAQTIDCHTSKSLSVLDCILRLN